MKKHIKAWFQRLVAAEAQRAVAALHLEDVKSDIDKHVKSLFAIERQALNNHVYRVTEEVKLAFAELQAAQIASFDGEALKKREDHAKAFEAKLIKTFEDCSKDEPSHWTADQDVVAADHALRKVK